jgi:hypothetical protein
LGEAHDPEVLRPVLHAYFEEMRAAVERHGGRVEKFIGDAVAAVFGLPVAHEDDALRAVRAAVEMQGRLAALNEGSTIALACRIGVTTGEVLVPAGGEPIIGDTMNTAARLQTAAEPGSVQIGEPTFQLVRDAVAAEPVEPLSLKGKAEPVPAYRVIRVASLSPMRARRLDAPMVGRERELTLLGQAYERTASDRACQLFTVLGTAGAGKSRLVEEFLTHLQGVEILRGRCLPYGEGITFYPVIEALKEALALPDLDDEVALRSAIAEVMKAEEHGEAITANLAMLLGAGEGGSPEETFWAIRRFFETRGRDRPLVVVFDDIHWGEGTFLDLIAHVSEWSRDASILLLCMARPDLLDLRSSWAGGMTNATTISLAPLTEDQCDDLIDHLLGSSTLPEDVRARITRVAEGNPLFVEEMLRMLVDDKLVVREGDRWIPAADLSGVQVPSTISALLSARLDRLSEPERAATERAAVIGREFHRGAVVELLPEPLRTGVDVHLRSLVRKELISPERSLLPGEDAYRFRHQLIRDTAYDSIPKAERAELHERFAAWLTALVGDDEVGHEETVGSHLERASRFLAELSPTDEHGRALASRAAALLTTAGFRARDRGDEGTAASLLRRADALLSPDDTRRVPVLLALAESSDHDASLICLSEAARLAEQGRDRALIGWTRAELTYRLVESGTPSTSWNEAARAAEEAIAALEAGAEPRGLAAVLLIRGTLEEVRGQLALANPWYARGLDVASEGRLPLEASVARGLLAGTWLLGETPAPEAVGRLGELLDASALDRVAELELTWRLGVFLIRAGEIGEGERLVGVAGRWVEDLGAASVGINFDWWIATWVDPWVLDPASWEADLRGRFGDPVDPACPNRTVAPALAVAQCEQGKFGEAERLTSATADLAGNGDVSIAATWHGARARALARLGRREEADRLSAHAVAMTADIDRLDVRGDVAWHRADVLRALGRGGEADETLQVGIEAFERKGFGPSAEKLRGLLGPT